MILQCITFGASPSVHHLQCITFSASPSVHHRQRITVSASPSAHHRQHITFNFLGTSISTYFHSVIDSEASIFFSSI